MSPQAAVVWRHTLVLAAQFDPDSRFTVLFDVLRTAGHDTRKLADALVLGRLRLFERPTDLVARRACALLERAISFMGGSASEHGVRATRRLSNGASIASVG